MPKIKLTDTEQVSLHIQNQPESLQPSIEYLRQLILSVDDRIAEHIKWNSPAFYYSGNMADFDPKEYKRDLLVMNLRKGKIMCVLPTGMYIKTNIEILEGNYTDGRRLINFSNLDDIKQKEEQFKSTIKELVELIG
jgi:hypothetical protein